MSTLSLHHGSGARSADGRRVGGNGQDRVSRSSPQEIIVQTETAKDVPVDRELKQKQEHEQESERKQTPQQKQEATDTATGANDSEVQKNCGYCFHAVNFTTTTHTEAQHNTK